MNIKHHHRGRHSYEDENEVYRLKDAKGGFVLCYRCGKSALGRRKIVTCDFCSLPWHLDCLDPPMANPPVRAANDRTTRQGWMCPNHVDHELQDLDASIQVRSKVTLAGRRKPMYKVRRPKHVRIVDTSLRRGFVNNGLIEIENEPSDDDDEIEKEENGVIYRVPERGIKLDFIDRIKRYVTGPSFPFVFFLSSLFQS